MKCAVEGSPKRGKRQQDIRLFFQVIYPDHNATLPSVKKLKPQPPKLHMIYNRDIEPSCRVIRKNPSHPTAINLEPQLVHTPHQPTQHKLKHLPTRTKSNQITPQSSIQIIRRHQQLQTQLRRNIHIRNVRLVLILLIVAEILAYFL